ncbi:hypothetical protein DAETH_31160 [Deinococcus aetherius]|uniref:Vitamin K epoxide reductase n=1 Tax=Deinococcus aetherius TaxID=200252 RepID=A0ABN6RNF3_9DEIO|nr:hypothetical protein [Deinococcus aetherius]BDP43147.1 hypothetical protein DAETH_31160 [Deinococcus aetherius]
MRRRWLLLAVLAWALFTFGPLLGVLLSSWVAGANGCRLDEAGTYPCVVAGVDVGGLLSTLFVLGWLMLVTIPVGVLVGLGGLVAWAVLLVSRRAGPRV